MTPAGLLAQPEARGCLTPGDLDLLAVLVVHGPQRGSRALWQALSATSAAAAWWRARGPAHARVYYQRARRRAPGLLSAKPGVYGLVG
ncbi:MAG: hypothetical protein M9894_17095 [Planctomycetes bacterium]|nr:hypothetical protein [Planctomycetota bacterium]